MKEQRLIEMSNKIETLGRVAQEIMQEIGYLKTMVMGDHEVIKNLTEFPEIMKKLKDAHNEEKPKEENDEKVI